MWAVGDLEVRPLHEADFIPRPDYTAASEIETCLQFVLKSLKGEHWGCSLQRSAIRDSLQLTVWNYRPTGNLQANAEISGLAWYSAANNRILVAQQALKECVRQIESVEGRGPDGAINRG